MNYNYRNAPGVTVVVDGFYGSSGKGKCAVRLAQKQGCALSIRSGGPNAGHTVWLGNQKYITRQLPSALAVPGVQLAIAAGGMVDVNLLERELEALEEMGLNDIRKRVWIDPFASIVEDDAGLREEGMKLGQDIGSTQTGTGWTQSQRVLRKARIARDVMALRPYMKDVALEANQMVDAGKHVIVEGTQGFGLSLYHGGFYPTCTSREATASGFASECGISPLLVKNIWMVIRTFPIRVGGNSGPMKNEVDWEFVRNYSKRTEPLTEMTSVTKKMRRVGLFDWELLRRAVMINRPTHLALHGLDYRDVTDLGKRSYEDLSDRSKEFIRELQMRSKVPVGMAFTGPHQDDMVDTIRVVTDDLVDGQTGRKLDAGSKDTRWADPIEVQGD